MEHHEREQIQSLSLQVPELAELWSEHMEFERKLADLDGRPHLTPDEQSERKSLQKRKLAGKDQIAAILAQHSV